LSQIFKANSIDITCFQSSTRLLNIHIPPNLPKHFNFYILLTINTLQISNLGEFGLDQCKNDKNIKNKTASSSNLLCNNQEDRITLPHNDWMSCSEGKSKNPFDLIFCFDAKLFRRTNTIWTRTVIKFDTM